MGNDFKKQTSTISANRALEFLFAHRFDVARSDKVVPLDNIKQAYRKDVMAARRKYGSDAIISISGRSITLFGPHLPSERIVEVRVPLSEMLSHGELKALEEKTGLTFKA